MTFVLQSCSTPTEQLPYYNDATLTPYWIEDGQLNVDTLHKVASFTLTNQDGKTITDSVFTNKVYVANFFFTICPNICPRLTSNMKGIVDSYKNRNDVAFISHSVTPGIDSVPRLKKYAEDYDIDSRQWHLVTGDKSQIYRLARQSYFAEQEKEPQPESKDFLHTEHFVLVDKKGHIRGIYKGTLELEMQRLKDDIRLLIQ